MALAAVDQLDAVHLPVQHDPATGRQRAVRVDEHRLADRAAGGGTTTRRRSGSRRVRSLRASAAVDSPPAAVAGGLK